VVPAPAVLSGLWYVFAFGLVVVLAAVVAVPALKVLGDVETVVQALAPTL